MHTEDLDAWRHPHSFAHDNRVAERGARAVMWITASMMLVEILAGWWFNSMALLADGWHMSSHALAIGLSAFAYAAARRYAADPRFAFGTWKIEVLGGFTSAILLLGVAVLMVVGSVERLIHPTAIGYREAAVVAVLGLLVNVVCALILQRAHHHHDSAGGHDLDVVHAAPHGHSDLNLRAAYLHVLADAATSVMAILALLGGWFFGWGWLDPVMGIAGAVLVALWSRNLLRETGRVLIDREMDHPVVEKIRLSVESGTQAGDTRVADLHVWRVGAQAFACVMTVVTHDRDLTADAVRNKLDGLPEVAHATVEVQLCPDSPPRPPD